MKEEEEMCVGLSGEDSSHLTLSPHLCWKPCFSARTEIGCTSAPDTEYCTTWFVSLSVTGSQLVRLQYVLIPLADMTVFRSSYR